MIGAEDASVFFARELDHVKAQSYDVEYPELTALHLFPQSSEADPGAETITYYTYDKTGLAKIIDNYSTEPARADVTGKPSFAKIKSIGDSYVLRSGDAGFSSGWQVSGRPQG